jgi:hypothetical protein
VTPPATGARSLSNLHSALAGEERNMAEPNGGTAPPENGEERATWQERLLPRVGLTAVRSS